MSCCRSVRRCRSLFFTCRQLTHSILAPQSLSDLKLCKQSSLFINSLTNANKFLDFEERDHFKQKDEHGRTMVSFNRTTALELSIDTKTTPPLLRLP